MSKILYFNFNFEGRIVISIKLKNNEIQFFDKLKNNK